MFDASAYELADVFDHDALGPVAAPPAGPALSSAGEDSTSPLDVAMAACTLCTQTFGGCAIGGAKAGLVSPALAFSVCGWMQRAAGRAVRWNRTGASTTYIAYVMLGSGRSRGQREADVLALAETMR